MTRTWVGGRPGGSRHIVLLLLALVPLAISMPLAMLGCRRAGDPPATVAQQGDPPAKPTPSGPLVVYSARSEALVAPLMARFTGASKVPVQVRYGRSEELVDRLLHEGTGTPAAAFLAADAAALGQLSRRGLLRELPMDVVQGVPLRFAGVPARRDWVGVTARARVVVYNPQRVQPAALPQGLGQLTDERFRGRFGLAPPSASFQDQMALYRLFHDEKELASLLRGIHDNQPRLYADNDDLVDAVARGEVDWGLANHYSMFRERQRNPQAAVANFVMTQGEASSFVNVSGIGLLDDDPRALDLVRWLLGADAQRYLATATFEYPLAAGVAPPVPLPPLAGVRTPEIDYSDVGALRDETERALRRASLLAGATVTPATPPDSSDEEVGAAKPKPKPKKATVSKPKPKAKPKHTAKKPPPKRKRKPPVYSAYASTASHVQARWRSPHALSMRPTAGQNFAVRTQGAGKAAFSRE